jgi:hypothetical protein
MTKESIDQSTLIEKDRGTTELERITALRLWSYFTVALSRVVKEFISLPAET